MGKILTIGGSNSKASINKKLAELAGRLSKQEIHNIDLNDYEMPLYGIDHETAHGIPAKASEFLSLIENSEGIIISLAEHNGAYSTAFKNIYDWVSRLNNKLWSDKPMLLMATSPGGRGGLSVLEIAADRFPRMGANVVATFSLPSFGQNYADNGLNDEHLNTEFQKAIKTFVASL
ncbi:MAG: NADPH-dependent FMN reductase [bacterium]